MIPASFNDLPHRRHNPLLDEWVLVSPHRGKRPWKGQVEKITKSELPTYLPEDYLGPGNTRANGEVNPNYTDTFVFENDFAALFQHSEKTNYSNGLLKAQTETGICKVICFSPLYNVSLAQMGITDIEKVIETWQNQFEELSQVPQINYVQIFENKGETMGCSNPHPHGQIWAQETIPGIPAKEGASQLDYFKTNQSSLLGDYLNQELELKERIVYENDSFVVLVPFWALWPFETLLLPRKHQQTILQLTSAEKQDFATAIKAITSAYDTLFNVSFPYSAGIHQAPTDGNKHTAWHWHMHFFPPLLRSATIKKFMVGYEMMAEAQRDITPEKSAEMLRSVTL